MRRLADNQAAGSSIGDNLDATAKALTENTFANNATLLGSETGAVFGGITSMESKIDNAGQTAMGDAACSFGDQVTGLSGVADPASSVMTLSVPDLTVTVGADSGAETTITEGVQEEQSVSDVVVQLTGLGSPVAKLEVETLGASSLDAISATASDVEGKSSALKSKIQGVASEVKGCIWNRWGCVWWTGCDYRYHKEGRRYGRRYYRRGIFHSIIEPCRRPIE